MKNSKLFIVLLLIACMGCTSDWLDVVPEKDVKSLESVFEKRSSALDFLFSCNALVHFGGHDNEGYSVAMTASDEFATGGWFNNTWTSWFGVKIAEGYQHSLKPIAGLWQDDAALYNAYKLIRECNIFLERIGQTHMVSEEEKLQWKAYVKAAKANYYFELVRMYGPIALVPENISVEADIEEMRLPRSHVDTCFNRIVKLYDEAIPHLPSVPTQQLWESEFISKEAAYAYKAKALLYAASPLFNGNSWYTGFTNRDGKALFAPAFDEQKWRRAARAIDEAVSQCEKTGLRLFEKVAGEPTQLLNTVRNIQWAVNANVIYYADNPELIHAVHGTFEYSSHLLPRFNSQHNLYNVDIFGNLNPSMRMVELFYTKNGLPIDMDKNWYYKSRYLLGKEPNRAYRFLVELNKPVLMLHLKREPRFYANIAGDGLMWGNEQTRITLDPYRGGVNGNEEDRIVPDRPQNLSGYWAKKHVSLEAVGSLSNSSLTTYAKFRMADLYLMQAEAWNEVSGPGEKVYNAIDKVRRRAGIPGLQEAWNAYSLNPGAIKTKAGLREVIRHERLIELAFEGHRFWDMRRWKTAHEYMNTPLKGWNVFGENTESFYNNFQGPVVVKNTNRFVAPRDYFWPVKELEVVRGNIVQNPGW